MNDKTTLSEDGNEIQARFLKRVLIKLDESRTEVEYFNEIATAFYNDELELFMDVMRLVMSKANLFKVLENALTYEDFT